MVTPPKTHGNILGYCTNVHAGRDLHQTMQNLERYAVAVRERLGDAGSLPIGLWLSGRTARDLLTTPDELPRFRDWLHERSLAPFTFNGFPFGDFHADVVKHHVYAPDWSQPARLAFTKDLINILVQLLPENETQGSISTLPLGWGTLVEDLGRMDAAVKNLLHVAEFLHDIERDTGRLIHLDLEPEPGCMLQRTDDVIRFFENYLRTASLAFDPGRYLRVCFDVCHAAVMFEDSVEVIARLKDAGIQIGKVQISSAVRADFTNTSVEERHQVVRALQQFNEPRYLHQTIRKNTATGETHFHEDLSHAIDASVPSSPEEWRVHFHVPVFLENVGILSTTQDEIRRALDALEGFPVRHFEIETYAWDVLPEGAAPTDLVMGIAREIEWVRSLDPERFGANGEDDE